MAQEHGRDGNLTGGIHTGVFTLVNSHRKASEQTKLQIQLATLLLLHRRKGKLPVHMKKNTSLASNPRGNQSL